MRACILSILPIEIKVEVNNKWVIEKDICVSLYIFVYTQQDVKFQTDIFSLFEPKIDEIHVHIRTQCGSVSSERLCCKTLSTWFFFSLNAIEYNELRKGLAGRGKIENEKEKKTQSTICFC